MKKNFFKTMISASAALLLMTTGCKKSSDDNIDKTDYTNEMSVQSQDQNRALGEDDAVSDDASAAVEDARFGGRGQIAVCGATASFDTTGAFRKVTLTYDSTIVCNNRKRAGTVVISMPKGMRWADANAVLTIDVNLTVKRISDNKKIVLNGTKTITNVSGNTLITHLQVVHRIESNNMSITFDDGSVRTWKIAKQRTITRTPVGSPVVISTTGFHSDGTNTDIAVWGTNRHGSTFSTRYVTPIVIKECSGYRITSGQAEHSAHNKVFKATFGLDINGNAITACTLGALYVKLEWTNWQGNQSSAMIAY